MDEDVGGGDLVPAKAGEVNGAILLRLSRTQSLYVLKREFNRLRSRGIRIVVKVLSKKQPSITLRSGESRRPCLQMNWRNPFSLSFVRQASRKCAAFARPVRFRLFLSCRWSSFTPAFK